MNRDPVRWRDPASDAPASAKRWLESVPRPQRIPPAEVARAAALAATVSAAAAGSSSGTTFGGKWLWFVGGVSAMMIAATVAFTWVHRAAPSNAAPMISAHRAEPASVPVNTAPVAQPAPIEAPVVVAHEEQPVVPPIVVEPTPPVVHAAHTQHHVSAPLEHAVAETPVETPPAAPDPCPADPLTRETCETGALAQLVEHDPRAALASADAIAHEFPFGTLAPEREYFAVVALQQLGRDDDARARGERLIARYPHSTASDRVQRALSRAH